VALNRREVIGGSIAGAAILSAPLPAMDGTATASNRLWYEQPAQAWTEALPIGNGRIGAMVFGGVAQEKLQLNEDSLWGGGPYDPVNPEARAALPEVRRLIFAGKYAEAQALANAKLMAKPLQQLPYQALGDLLLSMPGFEAAKADDYQRALDIDAAVATTMFSANGISYRRDVLASPVDQVIAMRITADKKGALDLDLSWRSAQPSAAISPGIDGELILAGRNAAANGIDGALRFTAHARVTTQGGTLARDKDVIRVRGADEIVLLVAMATSYRRFDNVAGDPSDTTRRQIERASMRGYDAIARDSVAEHRRLFRRVTLDLGTTEAARQPTDERIKTSETSDDPALAALYFQYARYLLISCSRPGSQAANLQGLWNDSLNPPWGSKYTININTEMNYWPAEPTNLSECVEPLVAMVRDLAETGARTAREMYGARGWVAHHNTDLWRATAPIDGAQWGLWPMGGAWLCIHLWDHYDYGGDRTYLTSVYPLLRGAALFFQDALQADPRTGNLVTNPSLSPENMHPFGASLCAGPAMDMQILRDLFACTIKAAGILATDADLARELGRLRTRLAPDRIGKLGQLQEWQLDWDAEAPEPHHRHVSHLYGLFPSHQINLDSTPDLARAARRSLELRGDKATGWATAWRANLWARLREGDHAHAILRFLLGPERTYPNMFDAHPPFQIDGNFGGASAITEMLMQSRDGEILLLPALPSAWPTGSVRGLRARGGCKVDLAWRDGQLVAASIATDRRSRQTIRLRDRHVTIDLQPGRASQLSGPALTTA
jgi:alpha-L-fucosidase 2